MTLDYIDSRDTNTKMNYIENTQPPTVGTPVTPIQVNQNLPPQIQSKKTVNKGKTKKTRRTYVKVTNAQKEELIKLFRINGPFKPASFYAEKVGIKTAQAEKYIHKLANQESIYSKNHYSKKSRTIPFQHLVNNMIKNDSSVAIYTIRKTIAKEEKHRIANNLDEIENNIETINSFNEEINEEDIKRFAPSDSSIRRFMKDEIKNSEDREIPVFSYQRVKMRGPAANTPENKQKRIDAVNELREYIHGGARLVCVDETHWKVAGTAVYGWGIKGDQAIVTKKKGGISLTATCSIDYDGFGYCNLITGSNDIEMFEAYFKNLIKHYDDQHRKCVFWCDNCNIHNTMKDLVQNTNHVVVYNAAYSPSLNPIELVFGIWKRNAESKIRLFTGLQDLIDQIAEQFKLIDKEEFQSSIEHVRNVEWPKVYDRCDL